MSLTPRDYRYDELEELPLDTAPSLDMPHLVVDRFLMPRDGGKYMVFLTHVDRDYRPEKGCPYCESKDLKLEGRASKPRIVHDVIRNNYRVDIVIAPPRMSCRRCTAKFTPEIKGISGSRQMTTRLEDFLRTEVFMQPFTDLVERSGFSIATISDIMDEEIVKYDKMRVENPLEAPRALSLDEKHLGRIMRGTIVDLDRRVLLDMFEDNKKPTFMEGIKRLKNWDKNIKVVSTDMSNAYIPMLKELLPNAVIVIDRFHVVQDIERCVTKCRHACLRYRKGMVESIEDPEERARQAGILRIVSTTPRLFNFKMERLLREEEGDKLKKLATVIDEFPEFRMLHNLHYSVQHLYDQETREDAEQVWEDWMTILPPFSEKAYAEWCDAYDLPRGLFDSFKGFSHASFQNFKPYILNYFNSPETRVTNAATEGLNNLIEEFSQDGNGYSFRHLRAKALYASLINERIVYGLDLSTVEKWVITKKPTFGYITGPRGWDRERTLVKYNSYGFTEEHRHCEYPLPGLGHMDTWLHDSLQGEPGEEALQGIRPSGDEESILEGASHVYEDLEDGSES